MANKRIEWIDYAKSIAILMIMIIHLNPGKVLSACLLTTIPIFYFISGYLFSYTNNPTYGPFVLKRFRQIVVPYLWINLVAYLAWVFVLRKYGSNVADVVDWSVPLTGIALGIPKFLVHDIPLWSLLSFFVIDVAFYPLFKWIKSASAIIALSVGLNIFIVYCLPVRVDLIPLAIGPSIAGLGFFALGYLMRNKTDLNKWLSLPGAIVSGVVMYFSGINNAPIHFYVCEYGNYGLYLLSSLARIYLVIYISRGLSQIAYPRFIRFVSKSTLIICGFHLMVYAVMKGICLFVLKIQPDSLGQGPVGSITFAVVGLLLTLIPAYIIEKYLRFLIDK